MHRPCLLSLSLVALLGPGQVRAQECRKAAWFAHKQARTPSARAKPVEYRHSHRRPAPPLTLRNLWTREILPVETQRLPTAATLSSFLRCHFTNQPHPMDPRLVPLLIRAAQRYRAPVVEIVSGYRSPKYNLMLHKKGHEVAVQSEHLSGQAVDFRIPHVTTARLLRFVKSQRLGGVGYYPRSEFVHADVGPVRFWRGD
jgi:uncharacterized protein YcbK (DUF882 family)